jgi:protein TonB
VDVFDAEADLLAAPVFTPMTVRPEISNRSEVQQALMRLYPPVLRDAGIGGQVVVWFFISEEGQVLNRRVSQTSGHTELDEAALQVADVFRFTPARNRDARVPVWIRLPITFQVN